MSKKEEIDYAAFEQKVQSNLPVQTENSPEFKEVGKIARKLFAIVDKHCNGKEVSKGDITSFARGIIIQLERQFPQFSYTIDGATLESIYIRTNIQAIVGTTSLSFYRSRNCKAYAIRIEK